MKGKGKRIAFWTVTLATPVLLLAAVEFLLRLAGLFAEEPLILTVSRGGREVHQLNPRVGLRYFDPSTVSVPAISPDTFSRRKEPNTFRIFCLGGSTTAGFPFDCQVPFPRQLQFLLAHAYPSFRVEVVNAGLAAVNSFTVLDLLPEILELRPDLILVHMGHNEFYGAFGSASSVSVGYNEKAVRLYLALQKLHLTQMTKKIISGIRALVAGKGLSERTLMAEVVRDQEIPYKSEQYVRTVNAFRSNLDLLCAMCEERRVPVFLSTLVSNVRDMPPFRSGGSPAGWEALRMGDSLRHLGRHEEALRVYGMGLAGDSASADLRYAAGMAYSARGDSVRADAYLYAAKDLDPMRFRATEEVNEIIRETARARGLTLVDILERFRNRSAQRLIGNTLICDHLHPNPVGYYEMARAFFDAIGVSQLMGKPDTSFRPQEGPYNVTDLDWDIGMLKVFTLTSRWPFRPEQVKQQHYVPHGEPVAADIARNYLAVHNVWSTAHYTMAQFYIDRKEFEAARKEYRAVCMFAPDDPFPHHQIAKTYESEGDWRSREASLTEAMLRSESKGLLLYQIAMSQWKQGRLREASATMTSASLAPELTRPQRQNALFYQAGFLFDLGDKEKSRTILQRLLREDPQFLPAREFLASMKLKNN